MDKQDLTAIGQYLHGQQWQSPLARDLQVNIRTMQRWGKGELPISAKPAEAIYQLAAAKQAIQAMPYIKDIIHQYGILPEALEFKVHSDNTESIHSRPWSNEADKHIKTYVAEFLTEAGIPARVVEV